MQQADALGMSTMLQLASRPCVLRSRSTSGHGPRATPFTSGTPRFSSSSSIKRQRHGRALSVRTNAFDLAEQLQVKLMGGGGMRDCMSSTCDDTTCHQCLTHRLQRCGV